MASAHQICKLKHKAKALKKKQEHSRSQMQVAKPNKPTQDPGDYLSKETIEANKKAAGKQGNRVISWAFKGHVAKQTKKHRIKAVHFEEGSDGSVKDGDEVLSDAAMLQSASALMGQGLAS